MDKQLTLGQLPIFISDKANISVEEMVAKCQKIREERGNGELGLVVIDYVQLMDDPALKSDLCTQAILLLLNSEADTVKKRDGN